jgi:hypothetical protein
LNNFIYFIEIPLVARTKYSLKDTHRRDYVFSNGGFE